MAVCPPANSETEIKAGKRIDVYKRQTEALWVAPRKGKLHVEPAARSLDLKGGQAVDRVGGMLGLPFPAGRYMEELALRSDARFSICLLYTSRCV